MTRASRIFWTTAGGSLALLCAIAAGGREAQTVWDGVYTEEQASRGEVLYAEGCGECHGVELQGDDISPPLAGSDFLWAWNGLSMADLFERTRISMPEGDPKSMSTQEKADVLAYMLQKNEMPSGDQELANSANALRDIVIEAARP